MARMPRTSARRLPENVRRRVEVATAMAWENLVATHVLHAGHFIMLDEPAAFMETLRDFLDADEGRTSPVHKPANDSEQAVYAQDHLTRPAPPASI